MPELRHYEKRPPRPRGLKPKYTKDWRSEAGQETAQMLREAAAEHDRFVTIAVYVFAAWMAVLSLAHLFFGG